MSSNNTDPNDKGQRHRVPLFGMAGVVGFVAILFIVFLGYLFTRSEDPTRVAPADGETTQND